MSEDNPFEEIGPDVATKKQPPFQKAVQQARDFYTHPSVRDKVKKAERLFKVAKEVKPNNPFSIAHAIAKTAEVFYEFEKVTTPPSLKRFKAMKSAGIELSTEEVTHVFISLFDPEQIETVETSASSEQRRSAPALKCYPLQDAQGKMNVFWHQDGLDYSELVCSSSLDEERVRIALSALLWSTYGKQVEMRWSPNREFEFHRKADHPWRYEGEFGDRLISRWKKAYSQGIRRFIILHGPPGTGKSTLARQLGVDIDANVLFVPVETIIDCNSVKYFADSLQALKPEVTIIDDFDRMKNSDLERLLSTFEETENKVPLLLATTNHLDRLPDAIKRPGRFDEIWRIATPPPEVLGRVISYLGTLEKVELNEEQVSSIAACAKEYDLSGAHIREIIRRILLGDFEDGWENSDLKFEDRDITFQLRPQDYNPAVQLEEEDSDFDDFDDDFDDEDY